jgi:GDP-L-fucose synthase
MNKTDKIFVAGHKGMVGSALVRTLKNQGYSNLILRSSKELDLTRQNDVEAFFEKEKPEFVFDAAARVGGIWANKTYRAEFIYNNLQIQNNVINSAFKYDVKKLMFFSSSCVYPRLSQQPMREEYLMTGVPEPTNEPYAVAKLAGMSMCRAYNEQYGTRYISVIPTNLYGPNDNYDPLNSHVVAAMILNFHIAKIKRSSAVLLWGSGKPRRELMYVDDAAEAAIHLMQCWEENEPVNIGVGTDLSVRELAEIVKQTVGYNGAIEYDMSKPDGAPQKLLDIRRLCSTNWKAKVTLSEGVVKAYTWFVQSLCYKND